MVDVTTGTLVNLFSSRIDVDLISAFYMDVREEDGKYEIFAIDYVKSSISHIIKHTVQEITLRDVI